MKKQQHTKVNLTGTIIAVTTSFLALFISIYETSLQRSENKAMVWPYVTISPSYTSDGFSFRAKNKGIGPALIKSAQVVFNDTLVSDYDQLLDMVKSDRVIGYDRIRTSELNNTVISPGEDIELLRLPWDDETRIMAQDLQNTDITIQFCSVLDDCWVYDMQSKSLTEGSFTSTLEFEN